MSLVIALKAVLVSTPIADEFAEQIQRHRRFKRRMEEAGVVPKKQEFRIPLIERIGTVNIHNDRDA
jgi:hypothetical protein